MDEGAGSLSDFPVRGLSDRRAPGLEQKRYDRPRGRVRIHSHSWAGCSLGSENVASEMIWGGPPSPYLLYSNTQKQRV